VLENFKYRPVMESDEQKVSRSRTLVSSIIGASKTYLYGSSTDDDVHGVLRSLESMVDTMK